jgi:hypothetical protein
MPACRAGYEFCDEITEEVGNGGTVYDRALLFKWAADVLEYSSARLIALNGEGEYELTEYGHEVLEFIVAQGWRVFAMVGEHFPFAKGHDRDRLVWAGMAGVWAGITGAGRSAPHAATDQALLREMTMEHQTQLRIGWVDAGGAWRVARIRVGFAACSNSHRPLRAARTVRSVRRTRTVRSGCSPGRSTGGDDPPPPHSYVADPDLRLVGVPG